MSLTRSLLKELQISPDAAERIIAAHAESIDALRQERDAARGEAAQLESIRAALAACEFHARACRAHNNANVLCLGERVTGPGVAADLADIFLNTDFEGGRHLRRVELFDKKQD